MKPSLLSAGAVCIAAAVVSFSALRGTVAQAQSQTTRNPSAGAAPAQYVVLSHPEYPKLAAEVTERLTAGYSLHGGLVAFGDAGNNRVYAQAMVR